MTHTTHCIVCGREVYCHDDVHALGCGGDHGEGGCDNPPFIEFCSVEHAMELQKRLEKRIAVYYEVIGQ